MSPAANVLLISDLQATTPLWALGQAPQDLNVRREARLDSVFRRWAEEATDLIIFDTNPPETLALEVIRELREEAILPILMLTSNRSEGFLLEAYAAGVDECIVKPISPPLLYAKIRAWLRRSWSIPINFLEPLSVAGARLIPSERTFAVNGGPPVPLTNLELRLLYYLMGRPGRKATIGELCERVWANTGKGDAAALKNIVYRLRRKIEPDPAAPSLLQTVSGVGYKFGGG